MRSRSARRIDVGMDADRIREIFAGMPAVRIRRMFGGQGVFDDTTMFALEHGGELYLKTDLAMQQRLDAVGSAPFRFVKAGKAVVTSYWRLPESALDDGDELLRWTMSALAAAQAAAKPVRRRGSPLPAGLPR